MVKCSTWECLSYTQVGMDETIMFIFSRAPDVQPIPLSVRGGIIEPGSKIHGMFGPKTSAQYIDFHPIAPGHLIYDGLFSDLEGEIAICHRPEPEMATDEQGRHYRWGWLVPNCEGMLFSYLRSGGLRTINTDYLYLNGNMPPLECIGDTYYWKKKAKREKDQQL